jgi:predicted neutral ceramidase superfamily lipid hydrolase
MKREIILAQLKAFQTYLKNHIEDVKSRPQVQLDEEGELPVDEHNANFGENHHIESRYNKLKDALV